MNLNEPILRQYPMTKMISSLALVFGLTTSAFAADHFVVKDFFSLKDVGLSEACFAQVSDKALALCTKESKKDKDAEHGCWSSEGDNKSNSQFELSFTVTDADSYWYTVNVFDAETCKYV